MKKIVLMASASLILMASFANAGLYRWVDESGKVHFSDKVPVVASRKAVSEINKNGVVQRTVDPEAEARAKLELEENRLELEKLATLKKLEREQAASLQKRDKRLLSTYENKDEITKSFINKIKLMKGNAAILDAQTVVLSKKLVTLEKQRVATKSKLRITAIEAKIINISHTINDYNKALEQNKKERVILSKNYKTNLNRYNELTK